LLSGDGGKVTAGVELSAQVSGLALRPGKVRFRRFGTDRSIRG
jgi:hypothetical protein